MPESAGPPVTPGPYSFDLVIIGGGSVAVEFAHVFSALGVQDTATLNTAAVGFDLREDGRLVQRNLLHPEDLAGGDPGPIPAAIFSRPQIAHFGLTEWEPREQFPDVVAVTRCYSMTAYGWTLEDETGFCKPIVERDSGLILGAHLIGTEASILIQPLLFAANHGLSVRGRHSQCTGRARPRVKSWRMHCWAQKRRWIQKCRVRAVQKLDALS
ncbi:MAG: hypothetical protein ACYCZY_01025 [Lacisediminihabitans sp.]